MRKPGTMLAVPASRPSKAAEATASAGSTWLGVRVRVRVIFRVTVRMRVRVGVRDRLRVRRRGRLRARLGSVGSHHAQPAAEAEG